MLHFLPCALGEVLNRIKAKASRTRNAEWWAIVHFSEPGNFQDFPSFWPMHHFLSFWTLHHFLSVWPSHHFLFFWPSCHLLIFWLLHPFLYFWPLCHFLSFWSHTIALCHWCGWGEFTLGNGSDQAGDPYSILTQSINMQRACCMGKDIPLLMVSCNQSWKASLVECCLLCSGEGMLEIPDLGKWDTRRPIKHHIFCFSCISFACNFRKK